MRELLTPRTGPEPDDDLGLADERFRAVLERLPIVVYTARIDADGQYADSYENPQLEQLTGYPNARWNAPGAWLELIHPADRDAYQEAVAAAREAGERFSMEYRIIRADGEERWCHDTAVYERLADGTLRLQGYITDVTGRRDAEERYRLLVERLPLATYQIRMSGDSVRTTYVSPQVAAATGVDAETWYANPDLLYQLMHPDDREAAMAVALESRRTLRPQRALYRVQRGDGRWMWVEDHLTFERLPDGSVDGQGYVLDVTDREEAERGRRDEAVRFRDFIDRLPIGAFEGRVVDGRGVATFHSRQMREILGLPEGPPLIDDLAWADMIHPDDRARIEARIEVTRRQRTPFLEEYRIVRGDGSVRWIRDVATYHVEDDGSLGLEGYIVDITAQREAEASLRRTESLESLAVLAGGVAHDFNNLLVAVLGHAGLARMTLPADAPVQDDLHRIEHAAERAAELARQMLAYAGRGRLVVSREDVSVLVREMSELLRVSLGPGITLDGELADGLPAVDVDATQLRQVVMNLVTNAAEAIGGSGGSVVVRTGAVDLGRRDLARMWVDDGLPAGRYVLIEVSDTGPGIPPDALARIFDPFFTTKFTGRGLGLAAVLGIVRGHRGALAVSSGAEGTRFRVYLPPATKPPAAALPPGVLPRGVLGRLLVVDDDRGVQVVARRILEAHGFEVETVAGGRQAIERVQRGGPPLAAVLADVTMPAPDGVEVLRQLRAIEPALPVVLMSGYAADDIAERAGDVRPDGVVEKPFSTTGLVTVIATVLDHRAPA